MGLNSARRIRRFNDPNRGFIDVVVHYCGLCDVEFEAEHLFREHLGTDHHAFRWCLNKFQTKRKNFIKERHGICIEVESEGEVEYRRFKGLVNIHVPPFKPSKLTLEVVNLRPGAGGGGGGGPEMQKKRFGLGGSGARGTVTLHQIVSLVDGPILKDSKEVNQRKNTVELKQDDSYSVNVELKGMDVSTYCYPVCFVLELKSENKFFYIIRELVLNVTSGENLVQSALPELSPYKGLPWSLVSGTHEALYEDGRFIRRLNDYPIPMAMIPVFRSNFKNEDVMLPDTRHMLVYFMGLMEAGVNEDNYAGYYHMLLYHLEYGEQTQIEKFNMTGVQLSFAKGDLLQLEVPGLEEKRPSVLEEDLVYVRRRFGDNSEDVEPFEFEARVFKVNQKTIWIESGNGLTSLVFPGVFFDVRFGLNRFPLIIMHRAIDGMVEQELLDYVFPDEEMEVEVNPEDLPKLKFFNKNVEENPEQKQAVINILLGSCMPAPYIVFGPPGTGKTITIVEAILQVYTVCGDSNIVVCAPSNAACDLLAEMLLPNCDSKAMLRLHSKSRDIKSIPRSLLVCSNIYDGEIIMPNQNELQKYRIICCTLVGAGKLTMGKIPREHITHVFIDECGQAVEPEAVAAVAGILGFRAASIDSAKNSNNEGDGLKGFLVLAGDPLQLGPVCPGGDIGLGVSLLERLMTKCSLYQRQGESFNPMFITKLVRNFRSHPDILLLPNKLFYENELEAHSEAVLRDPICLASFPVHFHGVVGGDEREGSSPSFFNMKEVEVVVSYLKFLLDKKGKFVVQQNEIGVLTPYTRQVYKLKQALAKKGWSDVEVGSTEVYQGREKRVMIISTVRSAESAILVDGMYKMGFLSNPKRFNVAITRAQARLIVVGDPYILSRDPNWMAVIELANQHSTYFGAPFVPRDDAFVSRLHPIMKKLADCDISK